VYQGPVVLLVDALTYSAADMFAAGFADNGIGVIIGADPSTGGGGANKWSHSQLLELGTAGPGLQELPQGTEMSLAFLRCTRTGPATQGLAIEDLGVETDIVVPRALADLISGGGVSVAGGLISSACETLAAMPVHRITVTHTGANTSVESINIDSVDFLLEQNTNPVQPTPLTSFGIGRIQIDRNHSCISQGKRQ